VHAQIPNGRKQRLGELGGLPDLSIFKSALLIETLAYKSINS